MVTRHREASRGKTLASAGLLAAVITLPPCPGVAAETDTAPSAAAPAAAPETAPAERPVSVLPEITVTATRRSELLSKVPISLSAFSQEALDTKGAKDFVDIARFTPGVTIDANGSNNISIRGIASSGGAGTTGIYIDDTPIQMRTLGYGSDDALPKAFDLERVEVLRGPQGTLFGAGAEGGAVRYIMNAPKLGRSDLYSRSEFSFTQGGEPSYESGIAAGTPLIENVLAVRASLWYRHDGGWIDRLDPYTSQQVASSTNYTDTLALRLAAKWALNEEISLSPSLLYQDRRTHDATAYWPLLSNGGANSFKTAEPSMGSQPDHFFLPALKLEADFADLSLIANTSYYNRSEQSGYSGTLYNLAYYQTLSNPANPGYTPLLDPASYPFIDGNGIHLPASLHNYVAQAPIFNHQETFAQEIRLQSNDDKAALVWTAGVFFSVNRQSSVQEINDPQMNTLFQTLYGVSDISTLFGEGLLPNGDAFYSSTFSRDRQAALFGEFSYALTDRLKATAGLRYSMTHVSYSNFADGPQNFGTSPVSTGAESDHPLTPKFSLSFQADRDNMYYATYAKGFRVGGVNPPVPTATCAVDLANLGLAAAPAAYQSDSLDSYEVGSKNRLGDTLRIATSVYLIRWPNIQQNVFLPTCGFQFTGNLGQATSRGGDLQFEWAPAKVWHLDGSIGITDARYTGDVGSPGHLTVASGDAVSGTSFTPAPPLTAALGVQYDFAWDGRRSFARLDYEYAGHNHVLTTVEDPRTGSYDPLAFTPNASNFFSLRAGSSFGNWGLSAFVDNLFNVHPEYPPSAYTHTAVDAYNPNPPSALLRAYTLRPRTLGLTATYRM